MKFDHQDPYGEEILKNLAYAFIDELKLRGLKS
jgi:hypothetical protein